ncbi:MAG TPA: hypothetical protein V6D17_06605 [Candidatus Obscuribacterales bacterium]
MMITSAIPQIHYSRLCEVRTLEEATAFITLAETNRLETKKSCNSYYLMSFLLPFLLVGMWYSADVLGAPHGYIEAFGAALLAGASGAILYRGIKVLKHSVRGKHH